MTRRSGRLVRCDGTNVDGSRCDNKFRTSGWRTKCHVHRFWGERGWLARKLTERRASASRASPSSAPARRRPSTGDHEWRRETRRRARRLVGHRRWNDFEARANLRSCQHLADAADTLIRARSATRQLTTDLVDQVLPAAPRAVRDLITACARAYVDEQLGSFRELGTGLRIIGVLSCSVHGIDLSRCPCWRAIRRDEGKAADRVLQRSLPELAAE